MKREIDFDIIKKFMDDNGLLEQEFCKICKITTRDLQKVANNDMSVRADVIYKITEVMGIRSADLLKISR
ncbi:MAG: helix-turn-helix domain-containing protein [Firmicutes bacterium]|nr:helix-turn-helix domain-containing protein [Bacillota bacterium]